MIKIILTTKAIIKLNIILEVSSVIFRIESPYSAKHPLSNPLKHLKLSSGFGCPNE
jgi:hypothetical protein